jgi:excinuclease UvrABC nuclease subunit
MKIIELDPKPNNKVNFVYMNLKSVTDNPGCYALTNFKEEILYLGLTKNLRQRAFQHFENPEKHNITDFGKSFYFFYLNVFDENKLFQIERGWLNKYELLHGELPPLNKIHSPIQ